ncbi:lamin tail domain-containing protein [Chryseobacterium sp. MEBOG06]|uniref:lamin tail domain-containing protein n=1 Tax=Chryseobacterium sp. MEBOG06 TaxID=2879938 RepID=UPI001F25FFA0|nr:lamin tail domain-containing protein [Chryseobacterium sp. MEBOG06]UKB84067.1 lamin tail domain-containing protein [Chryseobacterium sp. MEBOG06]
MKKQLFGGIFLLLPLLSSAQLIITEVYRDTPYSEYIDINYGPYQNPSPDLFEKLRKRHRGEFIEIFNASDTDLNLKDWKLRDNEGSFDLPDKIIKSGQFMVVVANNNSGGDYFPTFFSTTQGKEDQIIYQNVIKLSNTDESIALIAKTVAGHNISQEYVASGVSFQQEGNNMGISAGFDAVANPSIFYEVKDWQYDFNTPQFPNPLVATIKPPIKPLEDYVGNILAQNYDILTWDSNAGDLIDNKCNIDIPYISQSFNVGPTSGSKKFNFDEAGNSSALNTGVLKTISELSDQSAENKNTGDHLEQIKMAIQLSPNPTSDIVNVSITGIAQGKVTSVQVFSGTGALLFTKNNLQDSSNFNFSFSLGNQITGVYVANFTLNTGQLVGKNILKR